MKKLVLTALSLVFVVSCAHKKVNQDGSAATPAPESSAEKKVFFVEPADGATVTSPFKIKFGMTGMKLVKSGKMDADSGHHHLIVDGAAVEKGQIVKKDKTHFHYGKGETETMFTLKPGKHTLTLQFADGAHMSYGKDMSATISVNVEAPAKKAKKHKK